MWLKKKYLCFLFVCLLACCMICLKNTCKAYTFDDFDAFIENYTNVSGLNSDTQNLCAWYLRNKTTIKNQIGTNNLGLYTNFMMLRSYSSRDNEYTNYLYCFNTETFNYSQTSLYFANQGNRYIIYAYQGNNWNNIRGYNGTSQTNVSGYRGGCGLLTKEINGGVYPADSYFQNSYTPPPSVTFSPYSDGNISVNYNGTTDSFLKFNISRSVPQWALGKLHGLSGDMRVDVKLNRYMNSEFTTLVGHAQWYGGQRTSSGGLSIATDGVVYIDNTMLYYNQGYYLTIDLEGENVDNYPLYFLPYASTATSGDLLSPLIDTNSDLEILQNLQELVNIQNIGAIYDENFDNSGELLGNLDYNDYHDNYYYAYFSDIFDELHTTLLSSGDRSISFGFMGTTINLNSSDFTVPNNALKVFCNTFLTFALFMYLYKSCFHMFHKLQEGNLIGAMHTMTVDDESVYM